MAITTYSELLTALTNWRGGDTLQSGRYPEWISLFEAWFNRVHRVREMETTVQITMDSISVPGLTFGSLPNDYLAWRSAEWSGISPHLELQYVHPKRMNSGWPSLGGSTEFFTVENGLINIAPVDPGQNAVLLRYWAKVPALTAAAPTNWLLDAHPDLYLNGCLYEAAKLQRDTEATVLYKGARDEMSGEITRLSGMSQGEDAVRTSDYF